MLFTHITEGNDMVLSHVRRCNDWDGLGAFSQTPVVTWINKTPSVTHSGRSGDG